MTWTALLLFSINTTLFRHFFFLEVCNYRKHITPTLPFRHPHFLSHTYGALNTCKLTTQSTAHFQEHCNGLLLLLAACLELPSLLQLEPSMTARLEHHFDRSLTQHRCSNFLHCFTNYMTPL